MTTKDPTTPQRVATLRTLWNLLNQWKLGVYFLCTTRQIMNKTNFQ